MRHISTAALLVTTGLIAAGCTQPAAPAAGSPAADTPSAAAAAEITEDRPQGRVVYPNLWPVADLPEPDPQIEARIGDLLARMTLEEKVGQIIQAELQSVTPEDVRQYNLGSVLNGGGSTPGGDRYATPADWIAMADAFWQASVDTSDGGVGIPVIWGTDAVHGHNVAYGATIFPHNIGLGAANDPTLMRRLGALSAMETRVTGHDWTFGPTVAVARDDRWGRTYEAFSEDPQIVAALTTPYVQGLQGLMTERNGVLDDDFLGPRRVIATAKHFLGDGGTAGGRDQGDVLVDEQTLMDIHGPGYVAAIEAGVQTVMASYSSWQGVKMHGAEDLLTGVLKERMGFDGFVVGDWNGHGQIPGCTPSNCPQAINAGIDMFMVPTDWKALYENTLAQVRDGTIPMARLDDAVSRILRVKLRAGLFEAPRPSERPLAGDETVLADPGHLATAREAVQKSLVLLKNNDGLLPLVANQRVLVAGPGADNIPMQVGGWSLTWQGTGLTNDDFPNGTSIWDGIRQRAEMNGGEAVLSPDGSYDARPDVAIVVYGETPYAEGVGDRDTVAYYPGDDSDLELLRRLKADGIPVVSVFLSGRPLWVNPHLNASDAFVAAWLPGTAGGGVADVLFQDPPRGPDGQILEPGDPAGRPLRVTAPTGRLSFSWPRTAVQTPLNVGDADYDPLFPVGYGLTYQDDGNLPDLPEDPGVDLASLDSRTVYFANGNTLRPWRLAMTPPYGGSFASGTDVQAAIFTGEGEATASVTAFQPVDLSRETNAVMTIAARLRFDRALVRPVGVSMGAAGNTVAFDVSATVAATPHGEWLELRIPLACFAQGGLDMTGVTAPFGITVSEAVSIEFADIRLTERAPTDACPES